MKRVEFKPTRAQDGAWTQSWVPLTAPSFQRSKQSPARPKKSQQKNARSYFALLTKCFFGVSFVPQHGNEWLTENHGKPCPSFFMTDWLAAEKLCMTLVSPHQEGRAEKSRVARTWGLPRWEGNTKFVPSSSARPRAGHGIIRIGRTRNCSLLEMPVFIKRGNLTSLADNGRHMERVVHTNAWDWSQGRSLVSIAL